MGCWVRRFTTNNTTHHQHFLVKRCASANKPCMAGEHHGPNKSGRCSVTIFLTDLDGTVTQHDGSFLAVDGFPFFDGNFLAVGG